MMGAMFPHLLDHQEALNKHFFFLKVFDPNGAGLLDVA